MDVHLWCSGGLVGLHLRMWRSFAAGPARLPRPELVNALDMPKPKQTNLPSAVYMLHQLAHIELNAINLAWDTVARFSHLNLPTVFLPSSGLGSQHSIHQVQFMQRHVCASNKGLPYRLSTQI